MGLISLGKLTTGAGKQLSILILPLVNSSSARVLGIARIDGERVSFL